MNLSMNIDLFAQIHVISFNSTQMRMIYCILLLKYVCSKCFDKNESGNERLTPTKRYLSFGFGSILNLHRTFQTNYCQTVFSVNVPLTVDIWMFSHIINRFVFVSKVIISIVLIHALLSNQVSKHVNTY